MYALPNFQLVLDVALNLQKVALYAFAGVIVANV